MPILEWPNLEARWTVPPDGPYVAIYKGVTIIRGSPACLPGSVPASSARHTVADTRPHSKFEKQKNQTILFVFLKRSRGLPLDSHNDPRKARPPNAALCMPGCPPRHVCVAERRSLLTYLLTRKARIARTYPQTLLRLQYRRFVRTFQAVADRQELSHALVLTRAPQSGQHHVTKLEKGWPCLALCGLSDRCPLLASILMSSLLHPDGKQALGSLPCARRLEADRDGPLHKDGGVAHRGQAPSGEEDTDIREAFEPKRPQ